MSSKEQYKDLVKRLNQEIRGLKAENNELQSALILVNRRLMELLKDNIKTRKKKWYQFWKLKN